MRNLIVFLLLWVVFPIQAVSQNQNSAEGDRQALVDLYEATRGDNWSNNTGWLSGNPSNDWYGVEVDGDGRVIKLDLFKNNLSGELPETIGNLSRLKFFSVKGNNIYSDIPSTIANWTKAEWLLFSSAGNYNEPTLKGDNPHPGKYSVNGTSKYYGRIPDVFDNMPNLDALEIAWSFDMDPQPYPSTLYKHDNLRWLVLNGINLEGELQDSFDLPKLEIFMIGNNHWAGTIPSSIGNSILLKKLNLSNSDRFSSETRSKLTGSIPGSFSNLVNMKFFHLANHDLEGEIPSFIVENWSTDPRSGLREIIISNNNFTGSIPPEFGDFNLIIFMLNSNNFSGSLPAKIVSGMQNVILFNIRKNNLSGEFPNGEIIDGEWKGWRTKNRLRSINIEGNNFIGSLPDMPEYVGDMSLALFDRNNFEGTIPDTWEELFTPEKRDVNPNRTFNVLRLDNNDLQGIIPEWFTEENGPTNLLGGNRWTHRDVLENNVTISDREDQGLKPFGFAEEINVVDGESFTFDYSHKIHSTDRVQWTKNGNPISGGENGILTINNMSQSDEGVYRLELTNPNSGLPATVVSEPIKLQIGEPGEDSGNPPSAPTLSSPSNGSSGVSTSPNLNWNSMSNASSYRLQVAMDSNFNNIVTNENGLTQSQQVVSELDYETRYYWRVRAVNGDGSSDWSSIWSFITESNGNDDGSGDGSGGGSDNPAPEAPDLKSPSDKSTNVSLTPVFEWTAIEDADYYILHANSANPTEMIINEKVSGTSFTDSQSLAPETLYNWRVRAVVNGKEGEWSPIGEFTTTEENKTFKVEVEQNYPNPFNPSTNIRFTLSEQQEVSLKVYDMAGREVASLINSEIRNSGQHSASFDARSLASGIYFYRLITPSEIVTRKMTLMK